MISSHIVSLTPLQVFPQVAGSPWCMLLQSAAPTHPNHRFDILVADPIASLEYQADGLQLRQGAQQQLIKEDPFLYSERLRKALFPELKHCEELPFIGGAMGLWGYDLGRTQEILPCIAEDDLTTPAMALGYYDWALIYDHHLQQSRLVTVATNNDSTTAEQKWQQRLAWLQQQRPSQNAKPFTLTSDWKSNLSETEYGQRFSKVQEYLRSGDCYQINLTQRFCANYQGDELEAYQRLSASNQAPFSAFVRLNNSCILSVSPERFISLKNGEIETKPIKGTRPRSSVPALDLALQTELQKAEKDRAENLMIVDLLRNDIGKVASIASVQVPELFSIESFPAVHHLVSTIRATLPASTSPEQLLAACFPGGSITGAPKIRAMEIIEELEPHRRNAYCGAIGYISADLQMDTNITIRTLVCENHKIYCWAGGGIVVDSECASEYQECFDKLSRILPALA